LTANQFASKLIQFQQPVFIVYIVKTLFLTQAEEIPSEYKKGNLVPVSVCHLWTWRRKRQGRSQDILNALVVGTMVLNQNLRDISIIAAGESARAPSAS
jgi:hypothetical protein